MGNSIRVKCRKSVDMFPGIMCPVPNVYWNRLMKHRHEGVQCAVICEFLQGPMGICFIAMLIGPLITRGEAQ